MWTRRAVESERENHCMHLDNLAPLSQCKCGPVPVLCVSKNKKKTNRGRWETEWKRKVCWGVGGVLSSLNVFLHSLDCSKPIVPERSSLQRPFTENLQANPECSDGPQPKRKWEYCSWTLLVRLGLVPCPSGRRVETFKSRIYCAWRRTKPSVFKFHTHMISCPLPQCSIPSHCVVPHLSFKVECISLGEKKARLW